MKKPQPMEYRAHAAALGVSPEAVWAQRARLVRKLTAACLGCALCGRIGWTQTHHVLYRPTALTVELCLGCHNKQHPEKGSSWRRKESQWLWLVFWLCMLLRE